MVGNLRIDSLGWLGREVRWAGGLEEPGFLELELRVTVFSHFGLSGLKGWANDKARSQDFPALILIVLSCLINCILLTPLCATSMPGSRLEMYLISLHLYHHIVEDSLLICILKKIR